MDNQNAAPAKKQYQTGPKRRAGAADLCRAFMESEGWRQLFSIARGDPQPATVRSRLGAQKTTLVTPDVDARLTAYRHITAYGYGRPAEQSDPDTGRTLTDVLLETIRQSGVPKVGPE